MPDPNIPELPEQPAEEPIQNEEPLLDRRTAIAHARAIRREAAALERAEKEKAAETANIILEMAAPEPPKRSIRRQMAPIPVSNMTGRFGWLNDLKKLAPARSDAEEIVEQLVAESRLRDEPEAEESAESKPVDPADLVEHIITEVQNPHAPEAIVAQVLRESASQSDSSILLTEPAAEPDAPAEDAESAEPVEDTEDAEITESAEDTEDIEVAEAVEDPEDIEIAESAEDAEDAGIVEPAEDIEEIEAAEPAEDAEDAEIAEPVEDAEDAEIAEPVEDTEDIAEPDEAPAEQPEPKPYVPRRYKHETPAVSESEAAAQYRAEVRAAGKSLRQQARRSSRAWSREAAGLLAKQTSERTAKRSAKWNIGICLTLLFGTAIGMLVFERPTVSMEENRTLAKMPAFSLESYRDGSYTAGVAEYYNDTVPFRSTLKGWVQEIRKCMGLGGATFHGDGVMAAPAETTEPLPETTSPRATLPTATSAEGAVTAETTTTAAPEPEEPEREGEISNRILIVNKRGIMLFGGWETMGETYAANVNRFKESLPDVNMYSMVVPTPCSFYTPEDFQNLITSEKANIDYINKSLVNVTPVDVYSALEKHKDEPIFMRTDHHWTSLGSFYGAEQFSVAARVPFARMDEYERQSKEGYVGTLYGFSNDIILKENPEEFFWYVPKNPFRTEFYNSSFGFEREGDFFMPVSWYMVYMSGDDHVVKITAPVGNGRKLCVIKDSYGNALIPWLTSSFDEIYVIDMRYFKLNAVRFMQEQGITDVLFAMNSFSANGPNAEKIETIRVQ